MRRAFRIHEEEAPEMDIFTCSACQNEWERKPTRGRVPKLCPDCRDALRRRSQVAQPCEHCGALGRRADGRFCSRSCAQKSRPKKPEPVREPYVPQLGPLREAIECGHSEAVVVILRRDTSPSTSGCWEWQRRIKDGYPMKRIGKKDFGVHRLMAEAIYGPLNGQSVHHKCANTRCINPDHLQPISHRENIAEMLQRRYYLHRIAELEAALRQCSPSHPALPA